LRPCPQPDEDMSCRCTNPPRKKAGDRPAISPTRRIRLSVSVTMRRLRKLRLRCRSLCASRCDGEYRPAGALAIAGVSRCLRLRENLLDDNPAVAGTRNAASWPSLGVAQPGHKPASLPETGLNFPCLPGAGQCHRCQASRDNPCPCRGGSIRYHGSHPAWPAVAATLGNLAESSLKIRSRMPRPVVAAGEAGNSHAGWHANGMLPHVLPPAANSEKGAGRNGRSDRPGMPWLTRWIC